MIDRLDSRRMDTAVFDRACGIDVVIQTGSGFPNLSGPSPTGLGRAPAFAETASFARFVALNKASARLRERKIG